jgi:hypothetical protein
MINKTLYSSPVAIGGLGGSGTRVVAEILIRVGFYMGGDLNRAHDNLWFTLLFKRPNWFIKNSKGEVAQIFKGLRIFEKVMTGHQDRQLDTLAFIIRAAIENDYFSKSIFFREKNRQVWPRVKTMLCSKGYDQTRNIGWGWKEPNTHLYIEYLAKYFGQRGKYIHIIRHGLDMAYSSNQQQLYNWSALFDVQIPTSPERLPKAALTYWIKANQRAIDLGKQYFGDRFLVINFDDLCAVPAKEMGKLIQFLELDRSIINMDEIFSLPQRPRSTGRYKLRDLRLFDQAEFDRVQKLGFDVEVYP